MKPPPPVAARGHCDGLHPAAGFFLIYFFVLDAFAATSNSAVFSRLNY